MELSNFLSRIIGKYFIIVSMAMLINRQHFIFCLNNLINNPTLIFVAGFFILILGLVMVMSHNVWLWNWRLIITIISWLTLIKGVSILIYPNAFDRIAQLFLQNTNVYYIMAGFYFMIGILLCYLGSKSKLRIINFQSRYIELR